MSRVETIGNATLYLGDCREILPMLPKVDAVITDPPYLEGDFSGYLELMLAAGAKVVLTPGKLESFNWIRRKVPDWEYAWLGASNSLGGSACLHIGFEPILAYGLPLRPVGNDVLQYPIGAKSSSGLNHPWPKPLALIEKLIAHWTNPMQTALDCFMGSGTTGEAAHNLNRKFIGIEIDGSRFDEACRRIEDAQRQQRLLP